MIIVDKATNKVHFRDIRVGSCFYCEETEEYYMKIEPLYLKDGEYYHMRNAIHFSTGKATVFSDTSAVVPKTIKGEVE